MEYNSIIALLTEQSLLIAIVFLIALVATWALRNGSAHWRYLLWLLVLAKCFTPPFVALPLPIGDQPRPTVSQFAVSHSDTNLSLAYISEHISQDRVRPSGVVVTPTARNEKVAVPFPEEGNVAAANSVHAGDSARKVESISYSQIAFFAWMSIAILLLFRLAALTWATRRRLLRTRKVASNVQTDAIQLASELGLKRLPRIYVTEGVTQPFVWGIFRGDIYLPSDFVSGTSHQNRKAVLKHELAHVIRCDAIVNLCQSIAQAIFFFHPLVWWANRKIREEREKCCDEIVLCDAATLPRVYCEAIVEALEKQIKTSEDVPLLAVTGSTESLEDRIQTILNPKRVFRRRPTAAMSLCVCILAGVLLPTGIAITAQAQTTTETNEASIAVEPDNAVTEDSSTEEDAPTKEDLTPNTWAKGQTLDFHVITKSGEPISGVELELQNWGEGIEFQDVKTDKTDAEGRALLKLTDLPPKAVRVYPSKKGFVPLRVYWEGDPHAILPKEITIPMSKGRPFGGVVQNEAGEPIPNVEVRIHYYGPGEGENPHVRANLSDVTTTTNKSGRWRFDIMPDKVAEEELRVFFKHPDYISDVDKRAHIGLPVIPMSPIQQYFSLSAISVMRKGETLTGKVVDQEGEPIDGAKIFDCEEYWWVEDGPRAVSNEDGEFSLRAFDRQRMRQMEGRELKLTVQAEGYAPELVDIPSVGSGDPFLRNSPLSDLLMKIPQESKAIQVELKPAQSATGRVVDMDGKPIEGVAISASEWRGKRRKLHLESKTDAAGRFTLTGLPVDEVKFDFRRGGGFMSSENVPINSVANQKNLAVDHVITLRQVMKVEGDVLDAETGEPLKDFQLVTGLSYEDGRAPDWSRGYRWGKVVQDVGKYKVIFSQDLAWQVRIEAEGYMPAESGILREDDAEDSKFRVDFRLEKAAPITGTIVDSAGEPVVDAKVYMPTQRMNTEFQKVTSYEDRPPTTTDSQGRFELPPEVEPYCLVAIHASGIAMLTEQQFKHDQEIQLEPWSDKHKSHQIIRRPAKGQYVSFPTTD